MRTRRPLSTSEAEERQEFVQTGVDEDIRKRAYELYKQRGYVDGHELDDWLQAEAEIRKLNRKQR